MKKQFFCCTLLLSSLTFLSSCDLFNRQKDEEAAPKVEQKSSDAVSLEVAEINGEDEFNELLKQGKPTVAKFYATWCPPCKRSKPMFEELARKYGNQVNFASLNNDNQQLSSLFAQYAKEGFPTFIFFDVQGNESNRHGGSYNSQELMNKDVEKLLKK